MIRILVKEGTDYVSIIKRSSPYSIMNENKIIHLSVGWNELPDLKYGFYINFLTFNKPHFCGFFVFNLRREQ